MSVNNSIFKGDDFKLKFQMFHLGKDVLFVIWSMTFGKFVPAAPRWALCWTPISFLLFLDLQVPYSILSFGKLESAAQRGKLLFGPSFFSSFLVFALFFFLCLFSYRSVSMKFQLISFYFFVENFMCIAGGLCAQSNSIDELSR